GQLRFGPDVNYVDNLDYRVDESLGPAFAQAISRYFPGIDPRRLAAEVEGGVDAEPGGARLGHRVDQVAERRAAAVGEIAPLA
ncbi:hypothetical protein QM331_32375, partial [Pseudomonas aeruginosa]|nr:hypothetical protein [Pseudomonas aeruginosa]